MAILGERFCSCVTALATVILSYSLVGEAKAQSLPDGLEEHYRDCVGVALSEIDAPSIFEGDHLRALPAPLQMDLDLAIAAGNCLSDATGNSWAYDPYLYRFRTGTQFQLDLAVNAQGRALEARQQEERASDAARIAAEIALVERERRAAVWLATRDACVALYQDDSVAALTNHICQPLFLEIGLPSD
jgi:hypothetical protein